MARSIMDSVDDVERDAVPLADVLITHELARRTPRPPRLGAENDALRLLARHMSGDGHALLETLVDAARALSEAGTAGVSILEADGEGGEHLRWVAISGRFSHDVGRCTPRALSPSSICLDVGAPHLFADPGRRFTSFHSVDPPIVEALVLPLFSGGVPLGTIWLLTHDDTRHFDAEDVRVMQSLTDFTAAAFLLVRARADADRARAAAEAANAAKGEFLATMSHELRTPLNAIRGYAELVDLGVYGPVTEGQRDALRRIRRNERHLLGLINDVLTFTRSEGGHLQYRCRSMPLADVVGDVGVLVAPQLNAKHIVPDVSAADCALTIYADPDKVRQILVNLFSNAAKFTESGGSVTLACDGDERWVRVHVRDTGCGVPTTMLGSIFEPFVRVDGGLTRDTQGIGLGLAISRDLARGMGGDLTVTSELGAGATFTLILPRNPPERGAAIDP